MCSWVALLGISGALDWNFREKSDHNFALLSLFRCSISLFLFLVRPSNSYNPETPTSQLPIAGGCEEVVRTFEKILPGISSTVGSNRQNLRRACDSDLPEEGFLSCAPPSLIQPIYTPPYTIYTAEDQFSELALSQPQVTRLAPDGNSRRWKRWRDNIWLEQSQA